ncbi:MAG: Uncharacterised protein [Opitutia bacterium UBA7350]|nr:MAG: Uncharacterised protein [Opitutae bacterium UBA7350]
MVAVFFRSLTLHLSWFIRSFWPGKHPAAPLSCYRVCILLLGMPLFACLQCMHWLGFLADEIFFRAYRKVSVNAPIFITGIPRSGTTYVHRTLAADRENFCAVSTWEALLAPSITERKILSGLRSIDRYCGRPLKRLIDHLITQATSDLADIHAVALNDVEEDYLWLLPIGGCFILSLAFPFSKWLSTMSTLQDLPDSTKKQLVDYYARCIQKHLYFHGTEHRFLSKNAAFAGWIDPLQKRFPEACFLACVRNPKEALSSQLSSLRPARECFATDPDGSHTKKLITTVFTHNYETLKRLTQTMPTTHLAIMDQSDLRTHDIVMLRLAGQRLAFPSGEVKSPSLPKKPPPIHQHSAADYGLENNQIEVCLQPTYQALLKSDQRILPKTQENGTED